MWVFCGLDILLKPTMSPIDKPCVRKIYSIWIIHEKFYSSGESPDVDEIPTHFDPMHDTYECNSSRKFFFVLMPTVMRDLSLKNFNF